MNYTVQLKRSAEKELEKLPATVHNRVVQALLRLEQEPRPHGVTKLEAREGYRLRVGDYRIIYLLDDTAKLVEVIAIRHRRKVYR